MKSVKILTHPKNLRGQTVFAILPYPSSPHTSRKWAFGPGSVGPSVPVAQPGLANRDQCWSRLGHEPGPMVVHVAWFGCSWGDTHWSRFLIRTGTNECFFFWYLGFRIRSRRCPLSPVPPLPLAGAPYRRCPLSLSPVPPLAGAPSPSRRCPLSLSPVPPLPLAGASVVSPFFASPDRKSVV